VNATDYNSPSIEASAFWMLHLTDEPTDKADFRVVYAGLGDILATV
jgi:hypothetical protein